MVMWAKLDNGGQNGWYVLNILATRMNSLTTLSCLRVLERSAMLEVQHGCDLSNVSTLYLPVLATTKSSLLRKQNADPVHEFT
jgi:hypothetical protein